jgi:hypothetical protein
MQGADLQLLESFFTYGEAAVAPQPKPIWKPSIWAKPHARDPVGAMADLIPDVRETVGCPGCNHKDPVYEMIQHVNDHHRWSREKIADWIETLELDLTFKSASVGN